MLIKKVTRDGQCGLAICFRTLLEPSVNGAARTSRYGLQTAPHYSSFRFYAQRDCHTTFSFVHSMSDYRDKVISLFVSCDTY